MAPGGFFGRLKEKLGKTRSNLVDNVKRVFTGAGKIDEDVYEELEAILIQADVGVETTMEIVEHMRAVAKEKRLEEASELYEVLKAELKQLLTPGDHELHLSEGEKPHVTLVAGVNGSGKTTTTGKLAAKLADQGKTVLLGAADTFRAAAAEQLTIWSERAKADIVKRDAGADPASVAYDTVDAGIARGVDNVLIDTAGRLHTKKNLMEELRKIERVVGKRMEGAPHDVLLVLDATTGQNGLQQARQFTEALDVTGIVLTKLDGTAKGGMVVAIQKQLGIPIKMIGVGEGVDDLAPFDANEFVDALFE